MAAAWGKDSCVAEGLRGLHSPLHVSTLRYEPAEISRIQTETNQLLPWNVTQAVLMALAVFQPHHPVVQCSITHGQNCNSPSASSGLVRSMTPGPIFPSSLGFPVNCGPKFSNLVLSWKRTEGLLMLHIG